MDAGCRFGAVCHEASTYAPAREAMNTIGDVTRDIDKSVFLALALINNSLPALCGCKMAATIAAAVLLCEDDGCECPEHDAFDMTDDFVRAFRLTKPLVRPLIAEQPAMCFHHGWCHQ